jgi:hypothetical protein
VEYARLSAHSSSSALKKYISSCTGKSVIIHTPIDKAPKGVRMPDYTERISIPVK